MQEEKGEKLCALCAQGGTSCCQTDPQLAHLSFPLSEAEWQRLHPFVSTVPQENKDILITELKVFENITAEALRKEECNDKEFLSAMQNIFSLDKKRLESLFPEEGSHFRLRTMPQGTCVFLSTDGCVLPREARPWYCLLFPAWMVGNEFTLFTAATCLIAQRARTVEQGYALLDISKEKIHSLYKQLRTDWGLPLC